MVIGSCQQRFVLVFVSEVLVHSLWAACIRGPTAGDDTNTRMLKDVTGHLSLAKLYLPKTRHTIRWEDSPVERERNLGGVGHLLGQLQF